jgi:hypothetical protein
MKYKTISNSILTILLIGLITFPSIHAINYSPFLEKEISETNDKLDDYDVYRFCYVESGNVDHNQYSFYQKGFFWPTPPGFGIGRIGLDLKGWRSDTRLIVKSIFGTTIYDYDVRVYVIDFIGYAWPTVSIYEGILNGCTHIAIVSSLE